MCHPSCVRKTLTQVRDELRARLRRPRKADIKAGIDATSESPKKQLLVASWLGILGQETKIGIFPINDPDWESVDSIAR
jgi:hypothetical protein